MKNSRALPSTLARVAVLAVVAACAACSTTPDADPLLTAKSVGGSVESQPDDAREADAEAALAAASQAWTAGDALSAYALANRGLRGNPPHEYATRLRELRSRARASLMGEQVLEVLVLPDLDAVTTGDPVDASVVFRNRSRAPLSIPRAESGSSPALVLLTVTREDYDVYGNRRDSDASVRHVLTEDLHIPPGGTGQVRVRIPADVSRFSHQGFGVLRIGGTFRPVVIRVGEGEFFDGVEVGPASVRVFLENFQQLADDPLDALARSIEKRSPPHILTATELLSPGDRVRARELLTSAVTDDPPLTFVLAAAIARIVSLEEDGSP